MAAVHPTHQRTPSSAYPARRPWPAPSPRRPGACASTFLFFFCVVFLRLEKGNPMQLIGERNPHKIEKPKKCKLRNPPTKNLSTQTKEHALVSGGKGGAYQGFATPKGKGLRTGWTMITLI